ncbi:MerR family transcriptional regulator [Roseomonas sp. WA12]
MTITELARAVGETPRQIRYLISEGFIPSPQGSRAKPNYGPSQAAAIQRYQLLREEGLRPSQIKAMFEAEQLLRDGGQFTLAPGVVLSIDLDFLDPKTAPRAVGDLAEAALNYVMKHLTKETPDAA